MHGNQDVNIVSRDNINLLIQLCLQTEQDRGLSKNSIIELKRYLNEFSTYCEYQNIARKKRGGVKLRVSILSGTRIDRRSVFGLYWPPD